MLKQLLKSSLFVIIAVLLSSGTLANEAPGKFRAKIDTAIIKIQHKQADKSFNGLAYLKASRKYSTLIEKGFAPDSVRRNLAYSYLKLNKSLDAEPLYLSLIDSGEAQIMDYYYYAQSLKYNKHYEEADRWIEKYRELKEEDSRGELQHQAAPVVKEIITEAKYDIEPVWFNTKYSDFGAVVLDDQIIFTSAQKDQAIIKYEYAWKEDPYLDLFSVPFEKPLIEEKARLMTRGINSRYHDGPVYYSEDGAEVFVTRSNFKAGLPKYSKRKENNFMIYYAKRKDQGFEDLTALSFNSHEYSCGHPVLSADGQRLYFASDMPGGFGASDIYYVQKTDSGWSEPINLGAPVNTEGDEMFPFIISDEELFFSSNGHLGLGGLDVFIAVSDGISDYTVMNMGYPLNSSADDFSFYLYNETDGFFASNREGGAGDDDIYKFSMLEKPTLAYLLEGTTKSKRTGEILSGAEVIISNQDGQEILRTKSDARGKFSTEVAPGNNYHFSARKEKFEDLSLNFSANKAKAREQTFSVELLLNDVQEWGVFGFIYEKESNTGVENAEVYIFEKNSPDTLRNQTDSGGNFRTLLSPEKDYDIILKKEKYFVRRGEFSTRNMAPGWIDVKEFIEVEMEKIEVGKTIEIPNIYYDLAKWNIRPDAAVELDKVIQFLTDNEDISIELGSHTDARGSSSSNQSLSQKRAESAVQYIVDHGIDRTRITAKGYGESRLKNHCADGVSCSEEEHQENRRTEIMIVDF